MLLVNRRLGPKSDHVKTTRIIHSAQRTCTPFCVVSHSCSFEDGRFRTMTLAFTALSTAIAATGPTAQDAVWRREAQTNLQHQS